MIRLATAALMLFFGAASNAQSIPCRYEITQIIQADPCGGLPSPTSPRAISNHNPPWTTGYFTLCAVGLDQVFLSTGPGVFQHPTHSNIVNGYGYDITDNGWLIGSYNTLTSVRGYIFDTNNGQWIEMLPGDPAGGSVARAGNSNGQVVGSRNPAGGDGYNAYIYENGTYTDLGVMNGPNSEAWAVSNTGVIVGWTGNVSYTSSARAFVFRNRRVSVIGPIPGGLSSAAWAVNDNAQICLNGLFPSPNGGPLGSKASIWENGMMVNLEPLPTHRSSGASGIANDGTVVGVSATLLNGFNSNVACLWRNGNVFDLNTLIPSNSGVGLLRATAINELGQIACQGYILNTGTVSVVLSPVFPPIGDIDDNCRVNVDDLLAVINGWGSHRSPADLNGDGIVNHLDLMIVLENWTVF